MSSIIGGFPYNRRFAVDVNGFQGGVTTTGNAAQDAFLKKITTPVRTAWMTIQTDAAVKIYWTEESFNADANYALVTDGLAGPFDVKQMWMKSVAGIANVQIVFVGKGPA